MHNFIQTKQNSLLRKWQKETAACVYIWSGGGGPASLNKGILYSLVLTKLNLTQQTQPFISKYKDSITQKLQSCTKPAWERIRPFLTTWGAWSKHHRLMLTAISNVLLRENLSESLQHDASQGRHALINAKLMLSSCIQPHCNMKNTSCLSYKVALPPKMRRQTGQDGLQYVLRLQQLLSAYNYIPHHQPSTSWSRQHVTAISDTIPIS